AVRSIAPARGGIVSAPELNDVAALVLHAFRTRDEVRATQADFLPRRQAEELLRRVLHEILALDVQLARERHLARAGGGGFRVVDDVDVLDLTFRIFGQHDFQRAQHRHDARRAPIQVLADAVLELRDVDDVFLFGNADAITEVADRFRRVAATPQPADRRHPRIVPA